MFSVLQGSAEALLGEVGISYVPFLVAYFTQNVPAKNY